MADSKKYDGSQWEHSLRKLTTASEAVESPLYSDGTAITSYTLKGNTAQSGTPTPSNPVDVNGVGERTENLFSTIWEQGTINGDTGEDVSVDITIRTDGYIGISQNKTYSISRSITGSYITLRFYDVSKNFIGSGTSETIRLISGASNANPMNANLNFCCFEVLAAAKYIRICDRTNDLTTQYMMVEGEYTAQTMPAYEPYGYKIPISSGQQAIDIYIGDLPLLKSLDGTAVDEISNGTLTRRVDSDGSVLPTPTTTQITMPSILTTQGANSISVDTAVQPSEFTATWTGWHNSSVKEWDGSQWNE